MNGGFDDLAKGWGQATARLRALRKLSIALVGVALASGGGSTARADWTPPESSVTPPAVVTLDAFAAPDANGAHPVVPLVEGPDGAFYGSTPSGGTGGSGTLFRLETNGTFTKLHDFNGTDGSNPYAALVVGPDGALYGSTYYGGSGAFGSEYSGHGTLFRLETNGTFTKLHDFNFTDGRIPELAMIVGPDGALYGSTAYGGTNGSNTLDGNGTLFRLEPNGTFTKLHDFNSTDGSSPSGLVVGPDDALYGATFGGGTSNAGTLFRISTDGTFTKLLDFNGTDGYGPSGLTVGPDGALYGATVVGGDDYIGGDYGFGTLFRLKTDGTFTKLHDFNDTDGSRPNGALVVGPDGALYGSTGEGGIYGTDVAGYGTLFRLQVNGAFAKLHDFDGTDGSYPAAALVVGPDNALYAPTPYGGTNGYGSLGSGTLFRLKTNGAFTKLRDVGGTDGLGPEAALVVGSDGALYGSTEYGGRDFLGPNGSRGTLFRMETNGAFAKLHDFNATNSANPSTALVVGPDGALYGSTGGGGTTDNGTLFRVEVNGTFTKLHDFNGKDGWDPGALVVGPDGALYGSAGTLFRMETNGTFAVLHHVSGADGSNPGALVVGPDGALYGSTESGGNGPYYSGYGTLFRLQTNGTFTKLHDFNNRDGNAPIAPLVVGPDGALYGSTRYGGTNNHGVLFRLTTDGTFTRLHDFNFADGSWPNGPLVVGSDGALYGSTYFDGGGKLFRLQTNGTFTNLYNFGGTNGFGSRLYAPLVVGPDGALYGSTLSGAVFRLKTDGTLTKLFQFNGTNGGAPYTALVVGPDGALYGSTKYGGTNGPYYAGYGTLFRLDSNGAFTKLHDFNGPNGANPLAALVVGPDGGLYGSTPGGGSRRGGMLFKVVLNRPPVVRCHDVSVSAGANCSSDASVDNGSFDPDVGDTITLRQEPPGPYALGTTPVTLTVTDNHGASNSCNATVTVTDTTPPTIGEVSVSPNVLSPPNSKMVKVAVDYTATDDCGAVTNVLSVTSNEAPNGKANGTALDWVIEDSHHVRLRAERSGTGTGRVYAITVISTDNAGNSSTKTITVTVPKSQK